MHIQPIIQTTIICLVWSLLFVYQVGNADGITQYPVLEAHVKAKHYKLAYQHASKSRGFNEGDPRFDYLYGLSALQTGHYNEAVFALERVTASDPNVIRPRLELARAYLKLKNNKASLREFNHVLALNPPSEVKQNVHAYVSQINKGDDQSRKAVINSLVSFTLGYDDNINFGFGDDEIILPLFGNVTLDPDSVQQESGFAETKLQVNYRKADSSRFNRFASASFTHREHFKNDGFNLSDLDLRAGFTFNKDRYQYQLAFRNRPVLLSNDLYTNTFGLDMALRRGLSLGTVLTGAFSVEDYNHKQDDLRDRKRYVASLKIDKKVAKDIHQFSAFVGTEDPDSNEGKAFSRDLMGAGYRMVRPWNTHHKSFLKLDYQRYDHQDSYPLYPESREDNRLTLKFGHELKINKKLDLVLSVQHINNDSNLELYDLDRNEVKAGVRYEWN